MTEQKDNKLLHHLAAAAGFIGLLAWFYVGRSFGIVDWIALQVPEKYTGAGVMLGIMVVMTPGCFIWSRYNRWIEQRLSIKGIYYEDEYYRENDKLKAQKHTKDTAPMDQTSDQTSDASSNLDK